MKTPLALLIVALVLTGSVTAAALPTPERMPAMATIAAGSDIRVFYSFDHYANNPKVARTFISGDMLRAARGTSALKSSAWDVSGVVDRLTSLLSLHTHSVSTTRMVRKDYERVSAMRAYERIMQSRADNVELIVFAHRSRGKGNIDELLVFRFRDSYCSRVIQMTGRLRTSDIAAIIRLTQ